MSNGISGTGGNDAAVSAPANYVQLSDAEGSAFMSTAGMSAGAKEALDLYISNTNPNGDGYSHAQNLNYKLDNGIPLNATEKKIDDNIQKGMKALGQDVKLARYCHDDLLKQCGISDYTKLSEGQLQSKLVGMEFTTTSYMSTSYNGSKSPFAPGQPKGGGREVVLNINAGKKVKFAPGDKSQAEIILNKGSKAKIVGVHYDGTKAYPNSIYPKSKPRIVLDIEITE
jgi:hypothetical protein